MAKRYLDQNVYEATEERIRMLFDRFDNILISFSGGKDSTVCLHFCYKIAKDKNMLSKLAFFYMDYEADYSETDKFISKCFYEEYTDVLRKYWICLPISAQCSCSMSNPFWIPWDKDKKDIWVKDMPVKWCINEDNVPFKFIKGTYGKDTRINFTKWFSGKYGKTAVVIGIRCDESLNRLAILTSTHRSNMYEGIKWSKKLNDNLYSFYPIYDWNVRDIWIANGKFGWDYNKAYDLMYMAGLTIDQMRIASPFHSCGQESLKLYRVLSPDTWGKMVSRVNGANFMNIYGGTNATGYRNIKKPDGYSWKSYAMFLLATLPPNIKKRFEDNISMKMKEWNTKGYGRNPRVIKEMEDEGIIIEKTGKIAKNCIKDDIYQIVKIKGDMPDETNIEDFRHCPNWKDVVITILKNDYTCQYMGFGKTKKDIEKREETMKRYESL